MSTSETRTRYRISSLLLAMRQMRPRVGSDKVLRHLKNPDPSEEYHYLDALATLCSFASLQCSSVSMAVKHHEHSNSLYIATSPGSSAPPVLRTLLPTWISLIKKLRGANQSPSETGIDSGLEGSMCRYTSEQKNLIIEIYRTCHPGLLRVVNSDDAGQKLVNHIEESPRYRQIFRLSGSRGASLIHNLELLIDMGKKSATEPLSSEDLFCLHQAAGVVVEFKYSLPEEHPVFIGAERMSYAVDTIIEFATSRDHEAKIDLPWNVVWVDAPSTPKEFVATTDKKTLAKIMGNRLHDQGLHDQELHDRLVSAEWSAFVPSGDVHMVEGSSDHFKGKTVVHCESILLHYISSNQISVDPYIGTSHPLCYPCLMLVGAYNRAFNVDIHVDCRSAALKRLDVAWSYPEMGSTVDTVLENTIIRDFGDLLTQPRYTTFRPIVTDLSGLPEYFHKNEAQIG